ncbi:MAG TPA: DUF4350 domain-containing protein [Candidatus Binatia bacterium]|nr:DUF4350 domain-containing protein [Candidatus Binatia bacterium]
MATRRQVLLQQAVSAVLFVAVIVMLGWLSTRYKLQVDWTAGHRNTLTEASRKQLEAMTGPIVFHVFIYPRSELRESLESDIGRYQRFKKDISVDFIDPSTQPQKVKDYNISRAGEVVVEYQGRRESLTATTEQVVTTALQRLTYSGERWVVFLEGHGEHSVEDTERGGLSDFAQVLRDKGLKIKSLNLASDLRIPDNTSVLIIAAPQKKLLAGEAKLVNEFVAGGGNVLWLADPDSPANLEELAKTLGIAWVKGTAILLESAALGLPPYVYITTQYPPNAVTKDFSENALFPMVRALTYQGDAGWAVEPLLATSDKAWAEAGPLEGNLSLDPKQGDTNGPLTIGVTMTRAAKSEDKEHPEPTPQRAAVIGDGDFITNAYIGQLGNALLGLNLAQWLASRDAQLNIDVPKAPDRELNLSPFGLYAIYLAFAFVLPAGLLGFGVARWVVRRRR